MAIERDTLALRLRASVGYDAINGNAAERHICGKQMKEAADELDRMRGEMLSSLAAKSIRMERLQLAHDSCEKQLVEVAGILGGDARDVIGEDKSIVGLLRERLAEVATKGGWESDDREPQ